MKSLSWRSWVQMTQRQIPMESQYSNPNWEPKPKPKPEL
jgi:hypothetical protein